MTKESIYICQDRWCEERGARSVLEKVREFFSASYEVEGCRCLGYCEKGVNAMKRGRLYHELTENNVVEKLHQEGRKRSTEPIDFNDDFLSDI